MLKTPAGQDTKRKATRRVCMYVHINTHAHAHICIYRVKIPRKKTRRKTKGQRSCLSASLFSKCKHVQRSSARLVKKNVYMSVSVCLPACQCAHADTHVHSIFCRFSSQNANMYREDLTGWSKKLVHVSMCLSVRRLGKHTHLHVYTVLSANCS
jgi:hypothetical protein